MNKLWTTEDWLFGNLKNNYFTYSDKFCEGML